MGEYAEKSTENKITSVGTYVFQQHKSETVRQFAYNSPESVSQIKSQNVVYSSPRAQPLKAFRHRENTNPGAQQSKPYYHASGYSSQATQLSAYQPLADSSASLPAQRKENLEEDTLPGKFEAIQKKENKTGLSDNLKAGIERISGFSMDDVKVHYNSGQPAQLQAYAYAQGSEIHIGPGQEKHLPHEAWHVVQQKQGRVQPKMQMKTGVAVNDDKGLENEADVMGMMASRKGAVQTAKGENITKFELTRSSGVSSLQQIKTKNPVGYQQGIFQMVTNIVHKTGTTEYRGATGLVGMQMTADLDPTDVVRGSATDPAIDGVSEKLYAKVAEDNPGSFARGHLLNHDLGGLGVIENLYPISAGANARHSIIAEQKVKRYLVEAANRKQQGAADVHVLYSVNVLGKPEHSQFHCNWCYMDNLSKVCSEKKSAVIESHLNNTDKYLPAGHEIGLESWSHGKNKGVIGVDFDQVRGAINFTPDGTEGGLGSGGAVTVLTQAEMEEQRRWALANPTEMSAADKAYWEAWDANRRAEEAERNRLVSMPQMTTRARTSKIL